MQPTAGTRLGPYEIIASIGSGGMGEVFRARDTRLGRDVAIKILPEMFAADADRRARFEREAQTVAALSHPNIVSLFDTGAQDGRLFVVMELLDGETLRERLSQGALPVRKVVEYAVQIARGLAAAHDKGLVHRDLKPENIFLLGDGQVKILDFGLARLTTPADTGATRTGAMTDPGTVMGTVGYMAPEQIRGQTVDARTDLFALGAVLYEMLAGRRAFQHETAAETMTAILKSDPPEFPAGETAVAPALDRIIRHALEKNPIERFQTARDVAFALAALSGSGTAAIPVVTPPSRRGLQALLVAVAGVLLVAAGAFGARALGSAESALEFTTKTFDNQFVNAARFMPDGRTILYSARRDDGTVALFSLRDTSDAPQPVGPPGSVLLSVAGNGEIAILMDAVIGAAFRPVGTLARMTLDAAPRPVLAGVTDADWAPDGRSFAIVRRIDGLDRLEYPVGKVLYKSPGYLSDIRVSPDGRRVLFMDHQTETDDRGWVRIADADGTVTTVGGEYGTEFGTAWTGDGRRVFFSGSLGNQYHRIWSAAAPSPGGAEPQKTLALSVPGSMMVLDLAPDGSMLTSSDTRRYQVGIKLRSDAGERDMSWLDMSWGPSMSADGSRLVFTDGHGGANYSTVLRRTDGSPIARLGDGGCLGISPDGKWVIAAVLTVTPQKLMAYPTGPGDPIELPRGPIDKYLLEPNAYWLPDNRTFFFRAAEPGKRPRTYQQSVDGGPPRPVFPDNVQVGLVSRDGRSVVGIESEAVWRRYPIDGAAPSRLPGLTAGDVPAGWTDDGRGILVATRTTPARLLRVDLQTGDRKVLRELSPPGLEGSRLNVNNATADGEQFAYAGLRATRTLYVVKGVSGAK